LAGVFVVDHRFQRFGSADEVGLLLVETRELHAAQALQDKLARAIGLAHARADQTRPGHGKDGFLPGIRPHHSHGENAVTGQHRGQHLAVARLENVERKQGVGEQGHAGQRHDRN